MGNKVLILLRHSLWQILCLALYSWLSVNLAYAELEQAAPPFSLPKQSELNKLRSAILFTNKGKIYIELYPEEAPWHVANLKYLADKGFYKNLSFHLYYPDYIIQGGDPLKTGKGGPGYSLPPEFSKHIHGSGTVGMARLSNSQNPERRSNGSQFHILMREAPKMDNEYTIIGKVVNGMDVARRLRKGDVIEDFVVYVRDKK